MRQVELPAKAFAEIESELLPRVATLVKSYHLLHWTTVQYCPTFEKYAHPPDPDPDDTTRPTTRHDAHA
jgi:hypothetical protein